MPTSCGLVFLGKISAAGGHAVSRRTRVQFSELRKFSTGAAHPARKWPPACHARTPHEAVQGARVAAAAAGGA